MVRNIELQNTFSGPLDLLLYLVKRDEIDIHDIPVGHVTREYLNELKKMEDIDVDAGGEFLAMASMLTEIKGRMLLPDIQEDEDEDEEIYDPRQGLVEALLEYKKFKEVAAELEMMSAEFVDRYNRNIKEPEFQAVVKEKAEELGALDLLAAFQRIARRMLNERAPREIVSEEVPTEIRIQQIEEVVSMRGRVSFSSILSDSPTEDEMVGFFIAMLELIRMRKISAQQAIDFSEIYFIPLEEESEEVEEITEVAQKIESEPSTAIVADVRLKNSRFSLSDPLSTGIRKRVVKSAAVATVQQFNTLSWKRGCGNGKFNNSLKSLAGGFPPLLRGSVGKTCKVPQEIDIPESGSDEIPVVSIIDTPQIVACSHHSNFKLSNIFSIIKFSGKLKAKNRKVRNFDFLTIKHRLVAENAKLRTHTGCFQFPPLLRSTVKSSLLSLDNKVLPESDAGKKRPVATDIVNNDNLYSKRGLFKIAAVFADVYQHKNREIISERILPKFDTLTFRRVVKYRLNSKTRKTGAFMRLVTGRSCKKYSAVAVKEALSTIKPMQAETEIVRVKAADIITGTRMSERGNFSLSDIFSISLVNRRHKSAVVSVVAVRTGGDFLRLGGITKKVAKTLVKDKRSKFLALAGRRRIEECRTAAACEYLSVVDKNVNSDCNVTKKISAKRMFVLSSPFKMSLRKTASCNYSFNKSKVIANRFDVLRLANRDNPVYESGKNKRGVKQFLSLVSGKIIRQQSLIVNGVCKKKTFVDKMAAVKFKANILKSGSGVVCSFSSIFGVKRCGILRPEVTVNARSNKFDMLLLRYKVKLNTKSDVKKQQRFLGLYNGRVVLHAEKITDVPLELEISKKPLEKESEKGCRPRLNSEVFSMSSVFACKKQAVPNDAVIRKFDFMASNKPARNKNVIDCSRKFLKF